MGDIVKWIVDNQGLVIGAAASLYALATAIVAATPTKEDDKFLAKVEKYLLPLAALLRRKK